MAIRYEITGPVSAGEYVSAEMGAAFCECELASIRFFNASGDQVTPSAGTVVFSGSPDGTNWRDIVDGSFAAADAYSPSRAVPYAEGLMMRARIVLAGVVGADRFVATVWRK